MTSSRKHALTWFQSQMVGMPGAASGLVLTQAHGY
jgi:hypothetical protein